MPVKMWLITEDESDYEIVKTIIEKKACDLQVEPLYISRKGGIDRLLMELEPLIKSAIQKNADCIAVLHDADEQTTPDHPKYKRIKQICQQYKDHAVMQLIARDEIEAWLLADGGLCAWLGTKPENCDNVKKPKKELDRRLRPKKLKLQGRHRKTILQQLDGSGDTHSPSMRTAVQQIKKTCCGE